MTATNPDIWHLPAPAGPEPGRSRTQPERGGRRHGVDELLGQADQALAANPLPELFLIQSVDNDIHCDGTNAANYAPFAATLTDVLKKITSGAPKAKILIVSSPWATVENYGQVASHLPGPRAANSGTGPCDLFNPSGKPVPAHWRHLERITLHYLASSSRCAPSSRPASTTTTRFPVLTIAHVLVKVLQTGC